MQSTSLDIQKVSEAFKAHAEAKGWGAYHTPKNLAAAVAVESAELLEIFQWLTDEQSRALAAEPAKKQAVADEIADVFMYLVALSEQLDISLEAAVADKIASNRKRY
ncbi:nucleotide pyrophosphohydrolase [Cellvibrio polysaccharolyticus]|uniref:Nucleotide pyrophosphohydrolase n=1 Tax=Cellvibrio polysaccharolyticus TaxID=2082724 RepID=A0A928YTN8_9GAMM|nr:nucleotide pyrophosphohydrolase [Cellvibrio polysaccharolyticus]MBE8717746.1 nucleotide pyrophosphohydrolase [Cellvibrio polysaccharolyticus]